MAALGRGARARQPWRCGVVLAGRSCARGSPCRAPSTARSPGIRACRAASPRWCRAMSTTTRSSSAPTMPARRSPTAAAPRFERLSRELRPRARARSSRTAEATPAHLGPAVHRELPRALPVQPARQGRSCRPARFVAVVARRAGHRSRRQRPLRSQRLLRREPAGLRLLQGLHGARRRGASARSARCWAPIRRWSPTTPRGWRGSPARTRSRSTCRGRKRSCRPSGWRAITRSAPISCASAAPTTAGGATCSPASAIPVPAHDTYTLADMSERTLAVLRSRRDIACVLVNPVQALLPQHRRARRFDPGRKPAGQERRSRRLHRLAEGAARGLQRARHRADLRRGLPRLPPGAAAAPRNISASRPTS